MRMKILAVSDEVVDWIYSPHLKERAEQEQFGCAISCGDLPIEYLEYIASTLNTPCFFVRGNHDSYEFGPHGEIKSHAAGWVDLDMQRKHVQHISLAGLEGCHRYKPGAPYQYSQRMQRLRALWLSRKMMLPKLGCGRGMDILVAHSPPYGIHDGTDVAHIGFKALNKLLHTFKPRFLLHGHQHRNYAPHQSGDTQVGETRVVNVHPWKILEV
jgi:Icc-related predicted phosphoesterase